MKVVNPKLLKASKINKKLIDSLKNWQNKYKLNNIKLKLVFIVVGLDDDHMFYVNQVKKYCKNYNIEFSPLFLALKITQTEFMKEIENLNNDDSVSGVIISLPLPKHLNFFELATKLSIEKDVEGITFENIGKVIVGEEKIVPSTCSSVLYFLDHLKIDYKDKIVTVVGASLQVGKPLVYLFKNKGADVFCCNTKTIDNLEHIKLADIIVIAIGNAHFLKKEMIKKDAIVIDVGINVKDKKLVGDADTKDLLEKVKYISSVPNGVGSITSLFLLNNLFLLNKNKLKNKHINNI